MSLIAVFLASLIGSPHCAGMCGGFVTFYSTQSEKPLLSHLAYNLGRLLTYSGIGALAGFLGQNIDNLGEFAGIQRVAGILTGLLLLYWGLSGLLGRGTSQIESKLAVLFFTKARSAFSGQFKSEQTKEKENVSWIKRAFLIGALSTLLPCGWLYTFVAVATGTSSPLKGVLCMAVFWLGTLPIMVSVGGLSAVMGVGLRRHIPKITSALLILAGVFSIYGHFAHQHGTGHHHAEHIHEN